MRFIPFLILMALIACKPAANKQVASSSVQNAKLNDSLLIDSLTRLIERLPNKSQNYEMRGELYFKNGNIEHAVADFLVANRIDSLNPEYYCKLSDIYLQLGKSEITRDLLNKANRLIPGNSKVLYRLGQLYFLVKDYKKAAIYFDEAQKADGFYAPVYFTRALMYKEQGDTIKAIENLQIAVDRQPEYYDAYMQLGMLFAARADSLAIAYFRNAVNIMPQSYEAYYAIAMFYQNNGNPEKALEIYRQTINAIKRPLPVIHYNMGFVEMDYFADYQRAINHYDTAIILNPNFIEAYCNRGFCYFKLNNLNKARADYNQAIAIDSSYLPAVEGLRLVLK